MPFLEYFSRQLESPQYRTALKAFYHNRNLAAIMAIYEAAPHDHTDCDRLNILLLKLPLMACTNSNACPVIRDELMEHRHHSPDTWRLFWDLLPLLLQMSPRPAGHNLFHPAHQQGVYAEAAVFLAARQAGHHLEPGKPEQGSFQPDFWYGPNFIIEVKSSTNGHLATYQEGKSRPFPRSRQPRKIQQEEMMFRQRLPEYSRHYDRPIQGLLVVVPPGTFDPYTASPGPHLIGAMHYALGAALTP